MPQQVRPLGRRGLYNQVFQRGELPFLRIQCRESYPPPSRLPARSVRGRAPPALAHPPPVRGMSGRGWLVGTGGGVLFYTSHFKGGCCPLCIPHGGEVSPAGSVGVGKAPLALNASPAPPPVVTVCAGEGLAATGGGVSLFLSQGGRGPPWESPFSRGRASLYEGWSFWGRENRKKEGEGRRENRGKGGENLGGGLLF